MNTNSPTLSRRAVLQLLAAGVAGGSLLPRLATARALSDDARRLDVENHLNRLVQRVILQGQCLASHPGFNRAIIY